MDITTMHRNMLNVVERIEHNGNLLALIVRGEFNEAGIHFFTPSDLSQQLAYMRHARGKQIAPHRHNRVCREFNFTQEVLFIKAGCLRVDFYDDSESYLQSRLLNAGDVILLASGAHGFEVVEEVEMIEVKQGPYAGDADKTRLQVAIPTELKIK